ncbi:MAG TPA: phosphoglycerate mutase family protein [Flavobacteriaceae bacterium]|nr:phosphoglycerate mutase family protein [Flavobacteriaceae bacterium]
MEKTIYYLIRHAEKDITDSTNHDPHLTGQGIVRAKNWANFFGDKSIDMVYSTEYTRTIQTVIPTLDQTKLELKFYNPDRLYSKEFLEETQGKIVLIVGHQSSVPNLVNKLLNEQRYNKIEADVYNNLYTVVFESDGSIHGKLEKKDFPDQT